MYAKISKTYKFKTSSRLLHLFAVYLYIPPMTKKQALQIFEEKKVRTIWDDEHEKWYFSIVDVVAVLTDNDYQGARNYWKVLKSRLKKEGNESVTKCNQLKLASPKDGKRLDRTC